MENSQFETIINLISQKKKGVDCTEEESAFIKGHVKETILFTDHETTNIDRDIQSYFPLEWAEAQDEINADITPDLFETPELLPQEVQDVLNKYGGDDNTYEALENLLAELQPLGYTFDYYLTAEPYNLRKIETPEATAFFDNILKVADLDYRRISDPTRKFLELKCSPTFKDWAQKEHLYNIQGIMDDCLDEEDPGDFEIISEYPSPEVKQEIEKIHAAMIIAGAGYLRITY